MKITLPSARAALELQRGRARAGGYTSVRLTKATRSRLRELERRYPTATLETILNAVLDCLELPAAELHTDPDQLTLHTTTVQNRA